MRKSKLLFRRVSNVDDMAGDVHESFGENWVTINQLLKYKQLVIRLCL